MPEPASEHPGAAPPEPGAPGALAWTGVSDKRSYYRLFAGYVLALFATGIATVALALFAFDLSGEESGAILGTALSIKMLAYVVVAPVSAALTERLPRKELLITLDLIRAASLCLLPLATSASQVFGLVFLFALASATFTLVYMTIVPYLLGSAEDYAQSLGRSRIASELDGAIGPMLAAALIVVASVTGAFIIAAAAFLVSALLVWQANLPRHTTRREGGFLAKALRGPRLFLAEPQFRAILALDVVMALASAMVMVNTVVIIQGFYHLDVDAVATAFFVFGAGSVGGALFVSATLPRLPERLVMLGGAGLITLALLAGALADFTATFVVLWAALGFGVALALTPASFVIRRVARPEDLQTLFAAQFSITNVCLLVAYSAAGWVGAELGINATFLLFAGLTAAATLVAYRLWPVPGSAARS
jgi:predicted MFS family arabinose efflux permease